MVIYGVRDIFMGLVIYSAAYFGDRKTLGCILIAGSGVAFVDGAVCRAQGKGEWNHWSYAPILTAVGGCGSAFWTGRKDKESRRRVRWQRTSYSQVRQHRWLICSPHRPLCG
jgi:hypothetical protein